MTRGRSNFWSTTMYRERVASRSNRGTWCLAVVVLGVSFALGACAGDGGQVDGNVTAEGRQLANDADDPSSDPTVGDEESEPDEPIWRSPIQIFFDQTPYGEERHRETEELIFVCMKREGFEYAISELDLEESGWTALTDTSLDVGTLEFAEKYGFAISTTAFSQKTVGPDLVGRVASSAPRPDDDTDPFATLDEAGQEAYSRALFGTPESGVEDFVQGGCLGEAQRALQEADPYYDFIAEFEDEVTALNQAIRQDPRLIDLADQTSDCIASTGFDPYTFQDEVTSAVRAMGETHIFDALQLSPQEMYELEGDEFWEATQTVANHPLSDALRNELVELQAEEVQVAAAVAGCEDFKAGERIYSEVAEEYEEKFLADNAERMRFYQAELEQP